MPSIAAPVHQPAEMEPSLPPIRRPTIGLIKEGIHVHHIREERIADTSLPAKGGTSGASLALLLSLYGPGNARATVDASRRL